MVDPKALEPRACPISAPQIDECLDRDRLSFFSEQTVGKALLNRRF
jgi:hypothetical protein